MMIKIKREVCLWC